MWELSDVCCEDYCENGPRYDDTALYNILDNQSLSKGHSRRICFCLYNLVQDYTLSHGLSDLLQMLNVLSYVLNLDY